MKLHRRIFVLITVLVLVLPQVTVFGAGNTESENYYATVYVSPNGSKDADGTEQNPYNSIEDAQKKIKEILKSPMYSGGDIAVIFRGGTYRLGTVRFGISESGTENGRVIYRAKSGEEVKFVNSTCLDASDFKLLQDREVLKRLPLTAQGKVYVLDLSEYIDDDAYIGYGYLKNMGKDNYGRRGFSRLFLNGKAQTIARYPNYGYKDLLLKNGESSVVSNGSDGDITLSFDDENIMRWETADDMVIRGYMTASYVGMSYNVKNLDIAEKTVTLDNIFEKPLNVNDSFGPERRWFAENLLEEIDIPGEYYIDESEKKLYYYPANEPTEDDSFEIVCGRNGLGINMFELNSASYISFENISFEQTSYKAVSLRNSHHISFDGCKIAYTQSNGVQIGEGCSDITVKNCTIHHTAASGVYAALNLTDSQIMSLENTGIVIENNYIYKVGENSTYPWPAIHTDGVGDIVKNNTLHFIPVCGVEFASPGGNFLYNEIYNAVYDSSDSGAMHIGGDWRRYGINVEYNYIHDIGSPDSPSDMPVAGIYWDEVHSGTEQKNNFIIGNSYKNTIGLFMNGGRDHTASGNVIVGVKNAFYNPNTHSGYYLVEPTSALNLHPSHSGLERTYKTFLDFYNGDGFTESEYYKKYGEKADELADDISTYQLFSAKNLSFTKNVIFGCGNELKIGANSPLNGEIKRRYYTAQNEFTIKSVDFSSTVETDNYISENVSEEDIFVNPNTGDYRLTQAGKEILGITDNGFSLDESFDISSIGCQNEIQTGDKFNLLYPKNGDIVNGLGVTLVWEEALFADEYEYAVYDDEGKKVAGGTTIYTNVTVDGLEKDSNYTWNVTAKYKSAISGVKNDGFKLWSAESEKSFKTSAFDISVLNVGLDTEKSELLLNGINSGELKNANLIIAEYDGNEKMLKALKCNDITVSEGIFDITVSTENCGIDFSKTVWLYIWAKDDTLCPLADKICLR